MRLGCCTSSTGNATIISASTLDYVEENVQSFLVPDQGEEVFSAKLEQAQACGRPLLAACCFLPGNLPSVGPAVERNRILDWAGTAFHRAAQAGITRIVFGSGGSRRIPDGFAVERAAEQFVSLLQDLAPLARINRLQVVVEPLNPGECNFITSVREGAAIVRATNRPEIRLLADLYHMARARETAADLAAVVGLLAHVHVAEREQRTAPGVMGDDFRSHFAVLRAAGYDQGISLECGTFDIATDLESGLATVRRQWQEAGLPAVAA